MQAVAAQKYVPELDGKASGHGCPNPCQPVASTVHPSRMYEIHREADRSHRSAMWHLKFKPRTGSFL